MCHAEFDLTLLAERGGKTLPWPNIPVAQTHSPLSCLAHNQYLYYLYSQAKPDWSVTEPNISTIWPKLTTTQQKMLTFHSSLSQFVNKRMQRLMYTTSEYYNFKLSKSSMCFEVYYVFTSCLPENCLLSRILNCVLGGTKCC